MSSQPVPPSWKDLGKSSNDLLSKDFPTSGTSLEAKTKTPTGPVFRALAKQDAKSKSVSSELEAKITNRDYGVIFTPTWQSQGALRLQAELENQIANGLKLDVAGAFTPKTGDPQGNKSLGVGALTAGAIWKNPGLHLRGLFQTKGPVIFTADGVIGRDGYLLGSEISYNVNSGEITRYAAAVGFSAPEYAVTLHALNNLSAYSASYYHRVSRDVEAGAKAFYDTKSSGGSVLEIGGKMYIDSAGFIKGKISNNGVLSLGYTQALRPGLRASFGFQVDTKQLDEASKSDAHKVGASFTFEG